MRDIRSPSTSEPKIKYMPDEYQFMLYRHWSLYERCDTFW